MVWGDNNVDAEITERQQCENSVGSNISRQSQ